MVNQIFNQAFNQGIGAYVNCLNNLRIQDLQIALKMIEDEYYSLTTEELRKDFFLDIRSKFNNKGLSAVENTTYFIFLNRTCFNGLYRVNRMGKFNVPFGKYTHPKICDANTIRIDSELLKRVSILNGDFEATFDVATSNTLFYFDPPYRPLSDTSSFNDYTKESFNDEAQIRLKKFCDKISKSGFSFMLSNSDCKGKGEGDKFFDDLYSNYIIERVLASRNINSNPNKRGKLTEILVRNYSNVKAATSTKQTLDLSRCV